MPWGRLGVDPLAERIRARFAQLIETRRSLASLHASVATKVRVTDDPAVVIFERRHAAGTLVQIYNVSERQAAIRMSDIASTGLTSPWDHLSNTAIVDVGGWVRLPAYATLWLTQTPQTPDLSSRP
jgi:amylosucrase